MTEEIKKLIVEQAENYSERIKKNTSLKSNERIAAAAGFTRGAIIISEIILSKWQEAERWRKVGEELPEVEVKVLAKDVNGNIFTAFLGIHGWVNSERSEYVDFRTKITEWKPMS